MGHATHRARAVVVGKAKWKPLDLLLSRKIVNQKECCITGGIVEISSTIKDLKDVGVVIPTTSPFNSIVWLMQMLHGLWRHSGLLQNQSGGDTSCSLSSRCGSFIGMN